jgi:hypothetical protein
MSSEERRKILEMVSNGRISAEEAAKLMAALEADQPGEPVVTETSGFETGPAPKFSKESESELLGRMSWVRYLWQVGLWLGILVFAAGAWWMYTSITPDGFRWGFYCAWFPFLLGVLVIALAWTSRTSRWLYVNVEQRPGEHPQRITLGFPLPLGLVNWAVQTFGSYIPEKERMGVDLALKALHEGTAGAPLIVNVDDGDNGEKVQVYIG